MCACLGKKILVVGSALATGGILTGIAVLYFNAVPGLSLPASMAVTIAFGLAIVGTMVGFAWLCEKFDSLCIAAAKDPLDDRKETTAIALRPLVEAGSVFRARRDLRSGQSTPLPTGNRPTTIGLYPHRTGWTEFGTVTVTVNGWRGQ
jgi:membrane-bound ClpP family serine protease